MKDSLSALPCFINVENISSITSGLSQKCFKVNADNKVFFAKTITSAVEVTVALNAAKQVFSPAVYYYDQHWLITDYIDSNTITNTAIHMDKKINHAIKLMKKCHQLDAKPAKFSPEKITLQLINNNDYE